MATHWLLEIVWLVSQCGELRGKQDLWLKTKPETLERLLEVAVVQSAESSNRIEGVTVEADRLVPLVLKNARPRDRSEEEVRGYKKALDWIHRHHAKTELTPEVILNLHKLAQGGMIGDAGQWKTKNNEIIEISASGESRIRFRAVPATATPARMEKACHDYRQALAAGQNADLILIAELVFDFLCIHPFRDGNGRVSRLLTSYLLLQNGYLAGKYISLERLIEGAKEDYYDVLQRSSVGWHEGRHDLMPWLQFFLSTLRGAYRELSDRVESFSSPDSATELVRSWVLSQMGAFALTDLRRQFGSLSVALLKKVLQGLAEENKIHLNGRGRGARWRVTGKR